MGASNEIGVPFARQLAALGCCLVLIARRRERLESLAAELHERHGVGAEVVRIATELAAEDTVDMLINNTDFGTVGPFARVDEAKQVAMIHVHVIAGVCLAYGAPQPDPSRAGRHHQCA
jgi:uncharacterized protein